MMQVEYSGVDNLEVMENAVFYNHFLVSEILSHRSAGEKVLDFGAGTGFFAKALRLRGVEPQCVEADPQLRLNISKLGFTVHSGLADIASNSIDYVFTLNVLEHIEDDLGALSDIYRCLRPGGCLYIYVPAFRILYSSMDKKVGHLRRYSRSELLQKALEADFEVVSASYQDFIGFFITLVFKLIGNDKGDLSTTAILIYDRILFPLSRLCDFIFCGVLGKNLGVVLKKPLKEALV